MSRAVCFNCDEVRALRTFLERTTILTGGRRLELDGGTGQSRRKYMGRHAWARAQRRWRAHRYMTLPLTAGSGDEQVRGTRWREHPGHETCPEPICIRGTQPILRPEPRGITGPRDRATETKLPGREYRIEFLAGQHDFRRRLRCRGDVAIQRRHLPHIAHHGVR